VDETSPMVDARMPNGSRFNAIIPPLALDGAAVTIRMFGSKPLNKNDLLRFKAFTPEMAMLMEACIKARTSMITTLNSFRDTLEDLGGGLGVRYLLGDPESQESSS